MRLTTTKEALVDCLAIVSKAVSSRTSIQVLSGVLVEATDEIIVLSATDMEISIRAPLAGTVERPGSLVIPARIAADIARSLPVGDVVLEQDPSEQHLEITAAGSVFDLNSLPATDFPQLPICVGDRFDVDKSAFVETVDRVAPSATRDETRPVLTGVLIQFTPHSVSMVATDGYRLSYKQTPLESSEAKDMEVIIPARTLLELSRIAASTDDETISILPTENQILFEVGKTSLVSRVIDGQFPNYKQLIPETFDHEVAIDHDEFLEAIRRVALLAQKSMPLRLQFADNTLSISAESQNVGKAKEAIPVQYDGEEVAIGFNPEFLEAGVAAIKEPTVNLRFIGPVKPGLLKGATEDFLYLVMPIRLND